MEKKITHIFIYSVLALTLLFVGLQVLIFSNHKDFSANQVQGRVKFGATYMTMNNPFFVIIDDEIRSVVEGRGDVLITRDPALDLEKQIDQIYEFIDEKVAAIFINPVDWKGVKPALEAAKAAGIPVIAVDTDVYDDDLVTCTVTSDNYDAGVQCATHLMEYGSGGNIVILEHPNAKSAIDRIQGFRDTISVDERFSIIASEACEGQLELAMPIMEQLLEQRTDIDIVMALNDPSALGAMAALEDKRMLQGVMVYGVDGSPEAKSMIAEKNMTATSAQFPGQIGKTAAEKAYQIISGEMVTDSILSVTLITKENVADYGTDGWK